MPIAFAPSTGMVLICDFATGFQAPEMVKVRPVVIVSPRRRMGGVCTVVPLSSNAPDIVMPWHHQLSAGAYPPARGPMWAKCDMIATVACHRLDRVKVKTAGKRTYHTFQLPEADMAAICKAVLAGLGFA